MSLISSDARFLGVDLALLWRDMREPWRNVYQWPVFAWLTPQPMVLLHQADGQQSVWEGGKKVRTRATPQFTAVELPEEYVLRRPLRLPAMAHEDAMAAMALEARSSSPFDAADLVWGYSSQSKPGAAVQSVELVIASRKQIAKYLADLSLKATSGQGTAAPEVWVLGDTSAPAVLSGYGEGAREAYRASRRRSGLVLLATLTLAAAALAITPTIQLRARALEALRVHEALARSTAPVVQQRERLLMSAEALNTLAELTGGRIEPLQVLDKLTQVLPDDTALQSLKIQGNKLIFTGQTGNASALMQLLGEVPGFKDVRAPVATTRFGNVGKEVFAVELSLDPEVFGLKASQLTSPPSGSVGAAPEPLASASSPGMPSAAPVSAPLTAASAALPSSSGVGSATVSAAGVAVGAAGALPPTPVAAQPRESAPPSTTASAAQPTSPASSGSSDRPSFGGRSTAPAQPPAPAPAPAPALKRGAS